MAIEIGRIIVIGLFMFFSGAFSMSGFVSPSELDPAVDIFWSLLLTLLSGIFAVVFLSAFFVPEANNVHGFVGIAWLVGASLMILIGGGGE